MEGGLPLDAPISFTDVPRLLRGNEIIPGGMRNFDRLLLKLYNARYQDRLPLLTTMADAHEWLDAFNQAIGISVGEGLIGNALSIQISDTNWPQTPR
ncbi:hypothetical protein COT30_04010 [Candidatus Micrarchaeota archaeon CG08_land_8_20_14_0_20_49_17]|nr:MAG: hypothetical protein AUJ13_03420 [Candidatus Micrarchaeota archaeon CG1_02_49_24]PIU09506.1 MAG: hypothetical protein COT30_04010 [Candidatus Micrarchaeota archaeon CG08_land_8_20_14_0_20_49_17]PIU82504.1 MAG: hypothetical protein COS70_00970 [Candidatus Micrarchaeota archaeon CG06_land_8_20_14_3_00_50_6]PIZ94071.1 MAG: hypothetical protein COX84_05570 [Candidatus Micrarchaeota archaeon CG_4_10_14_0_2_um_filter_49_7]